MSEPLLTRRRFERHRRFIRNRLSPGGYLGLHLTIGLVLMILGCWCFAEISDELAPDEPLVQLDRRVTSWIEGQGTPQLTAIAHFVSDLGSVRFLAAVSLICAVICVVRKWWDRLLALTLTMGGGSLLNLLLKHFFQRERPVFENPLVTLGSFSFPSGHTMGATLFYGLLAVFVMQATRRAHWWIAVLATSSLCASAIGLTRIYLGAHYLSDVLAAFVAAFVWLTFSWTTVETFRRRRHHREAAAAAAPA